MKNLEYKNINRPKTIQEYFKLFLSNKPVIIIILLLAVLIGVYRIMTMRPVYKSEANVMIADNEDIQNIIDFRSALNQRAISNEIEVLKSRELKRKLIIDLWNSPLRDSLFIFGNRTIPAEDLNFLEIFDIKLKRFWWNLSNRVQYSIRGSFHKTYNRSDLKNEPGELSKKNIDTWNRSVSENIPIGLNREKLEAITDNLKIEITPITETSIINIALESHGKKEAEYILDKFIEIYKSSDVSRNAREINNLMGFLEKKIQDQEEDMESARIRLKNYQTRAEVFGMDNNNRVILDQATEMEAQYYQIKIDLESKKMELKGLKDQLSEEEKKLVNELFNTINSELIALREELARNQARLVKIRHQYGSSHDEINNIEENIKRIKNEIARKTKLYVKDGIKISDPLGYSQTLVSRILEAESELAALELREEEFRKIMERYNQKIRELPEKQLLYAKYKRELDVLEQNYLYLRQRYEEAKISRAFESGNVKVIDHASFAEKLKPDPQKDIMLSILIGLGFSFLFVVLKDNLNKKIQSVEELEWYDLPLIGQIPNLKLNGKNKINGLDKSLVAYHKPNSDSAELFRKLRTNIQFSTHDAPIKTILVTSHNPKEGKTTIAGNLAIIYANLGKNVLLVDADLRKSNIHNIFNQDIEPGLTEYLSGEAVIKDIIKPSSYENLYIITAGSLKPNPAELIDSHKMMQLANKLKSHWDIIIFDAPPLQPVTDSLVLCKIMDYIIIASFYNRTRIDALIDSINEINKINEKIGGVILTGIKRSAMKYRYKKYYKYDSGHKTKKKKIKNK